MIPLNKPYEVKHLNSFIKDLEALPFLVLDEKKKKSFKENLDAVSTGYFAKITIALKNKPGTFSRLFGSGKTGHIGQITWNEKGQAYVFDAKNDEFFANLYEFKTFEELIAFLKVFENDQNHKEVDEIVPEEVVENSINDYITQRRQQNERIR